MPSFSEKSASHDPAVELLRKLGYSYLTQAEALALRGGRRNRYVLEPVLQEWLENNNSIMHKNKRVPFSAENIRYAVDAVARVPYEGLFTCNKKIYELLTLGKSFKQNIAGNAKSYTINYINWQEPDKNIYQVSDEYEVECSNSSRTRRPDIVLFVNGIPLVIIECKRPGLGKDAVKEGINQLLRYQQPDEIPELFAFAQILLSISQNKAKYATISADENFWFTWQEDNGGEDELQRLIGARLPSPQDQLIYALLRRQRLLELIYQFIIFDGNTKKICRYQQYFAIKATLARVTNTRGDAQRHGGVIWHTTGSGKSLTMVMLAKAIALAKSIKNPRVLVVTDRIDLDNQIHTTFQNCDKGDELAKATSGTNLLKLLRENKKTIITTIIDKFSSASKNKQQVKINGNNIFVLVDESHRSQYGRTHAMMKVIMPEACYIGFTGTPLLKKDKSTAQKFGGFIHKYTMRQAVKDKVVVPLLYEGRMSELRGDETALDRWFERTTENLHAKQKADLKRKFKREETVLKGDSRLMEIAYDIQMHFLNNFSGTEFKAQLACSSKESAIKYKKHFDDFGKISAEVVISAPDTREHHDDQDESGSALVQAFWKKEMGSYGNEKNYNQEIIEAFKNSSEPQLLIVVDKLLTGFDVPRNKVLYIDKQLSEHNILQAIARVNRVFPDKEHGLIIDYRGIFTKMNEAVDTYAALENAGFAHQDVEDTLTNVDEEIAKLSQRHTNVWEVFKEVKNTNDIEALARHLEPLDGRQDFYAKLNIFAKTWQLASSNAKFLTDTPQGVKDRYGEDFRTFVKLRAAVKQRYGEVVDYSNYEKQLINMVNKSVKAEPVKTIIEQTSIFKKEAFDAEIAAIDGDAAKADTIAHRTQRTINEKIDEDPAFYKRLSKIINDTIEAHRERRLSDAEYLSKITDIYHETIDKDRQAYPSKIKNNEYACVYYDIIEDKTDTLVEINTDLALAVHAIIEKHKIRDWIHNRDVQNKMEVELEKIIFACDEEHNLGLRSDDIDAIISQILTTARKRST